MDYRLRWTGVHDLMRQVGLTDAVDSPDLVTNTQTLYDLYLNSVAHVGITISQLP